MLVGSPLAICPMLRSLAPSNPGTPRPPICTPQFSSLLRTKLAPLCDRCRNVISLRISVGPRAHGLSWLDLAEGRLRLDLLGRNGAGETFFPWASPIPREPRKSLRHHPPLRSGPKVGASSIAFGLQIAIEAAMVAGSNSKGEVTWQASAPSRSPATSFRAKS
jgi:hypothetical protein